MTFRGVMITILTILTILLFHHPALCKDRNNKIYYPALVDNFYMMELAQPTWFANPGGVADIRKRFVFILDSAAYHGLDKEKYHYNAIVNSAATTDTDEITTNNKILIDGVIAYSKDLYAGNDIPKWLNNDEISSRYATADNAFLLGKLATVKTGEELSSLLSTLEPGEKDYTMLKTELAKQLVARDDMLAQQVIASMDFYRWVGHFHFDKYIVVNIPSATLRYFEHGPKLDMKVVVGKLSTKTLLFSTWCKQVILYPYWNVPEEIGLKELLPKFKKSPGELASMNMQVVTDKGTVVDPSGINWSQYNQNNFPYNFRQQTGCSNALGVIKFNLTDPFDIYLHDTNLKSAFQKKSRYLSHGCIRLEKPLDLGNYLLNNQIDENFVNACVKDQKPVINNLSSPVPVFVVYMPVTVVQDSVQYHDDIYHLF